MDQTGLHRLFVPEGQREGSRRQASKTRSHRIAVPPDKPPRQWRQNLRSSHDSERTLPGALRKASTKSRFRFEREAYKRRLQSPTSARKAQTFSMLHRGQASASRFAGRRLKSPLLYAHSPMGNDFLADALIAPIRWLRSYLACAPAIVFLSPSGTHENAFAETLFG
jgi:hypothetical protein